MRRRLQCEQLEPRYALFADLVPALVDMPNRAAIGAAVSVSVDVDNTGNLASGSYVVEFRLSTDATVTRTDRLLASVTRSTIAAGKDSRWMQTITIPADVAPGTYTLGIVVDPLNKIRENSEANNTRGDLSASELFRNSLTGSVTYGTSTKSVSLRPLVVGAELYNDRPTWIVVHAGVPGGGRSQQGKELHQGSPLAGHHHRLAYRHRLRSGSGRFADSWQRRRHPFG